MIFSQYVTEKLNDTVSVTPAQIKNIKDSTKNNDHTGARLDIAKILGDKVLIKSYEYIAKEHARLRNLTPQLSASRNELDKELKKVLQKKLSAEDFKAVWGSL